MSDTLIFTGWGLPVYASAAAMALRCKFACDADVEGVSRRLYVQVTYVMDSDETEKREFDALKAVPDQYSKLVLSLDRVDLSQEGIVHRYLPDFLLEAE